MSHCFSRRAPGQRGLFVTRSLHSIARLALSALALTAGCAAGAEDDPDELGEEAESFAVLPDFWDDLFSRWGWEAPNETGSDGGGTPNGGGATSGGRAPSMAQLPRVNGPCPQFRDGYVEVGGASIALTVGNGRGPLVFYWHGTGTSSSEVGIALPGATVDVKLSGGIVASFEDTSGLGDNTGNYVWYTGDIDAADQVVACGIQAGLVDPARIYSAGYSAGGLQTGTMVFSRSNYLASAVVYSGGPALGGLAFGSTTFADRSNIPAVLGAHGAAGSDWLVLDFSEGTRLVGSTVAAAGGYAIDCDDGGDHAISWFVQRAGVNGMAWQFLKDHPYGARPSSYQSLPAGFPSYCSIMR